MKDEIKFWLFMILLSIIIVFVFSFSKEEDYSNHNPKSPMVISIPMAR